MRVGVNSLRQQFATGSDGEDEIDTHGDDESWMRKSMTDFDIETLPKEVVRRRGGVQVAQYPGIIDNGRDATTKLFSDAASAEAATRSGLTRLFAIAERKELRGQVRWLPAMDEAKIKLGGLVSATSMESSLIDLLARMSFVENEPLVTSSAEFQRRRGERARRIAEATQELAGWLSNLSEAYFEARKQIESTSGNRYGAALGDVKQQVKWLTPESFLSRVPWQWLQHYPRYFRAIAYRLDKLRSGAGPRDAECMMTINDLWKRWHEGLIENERDAASQVESEFRWMIEELRVSSYAQPLGTSIKVSPKRCEKLLS